MFIQPIPFINPLISTSTLKIEDNRNNPNDKPLMLISKINFGQNQSSNLFSNIAFLSDQRLAVSFNNYIKIFSKNLFQTDIIIEMNKDILKRYYDYNHNVNYLIQLKNGNLAVAVQWEKVFFLKIEKNAFILKGKIYSLNVYKIIENNNYLYNLENHEISIWHQKKDNYEKEKRIKIEDCSFKNILSINEYELLGYYGSKLLFYNHKTNTKQIEHFIMGYTKGNYHGNMISINSSTVLIYICDKNLIDGDIFLIDTFKKKVISQTRLKLLIFSIIKLRNGDLLCGAMEEYIYYNNRSKIVTLTLENNNLTIINSQVCHTNLIRGILELKNGKIISLGDEGSIKIWKK